MIDWRLWHMKLKLRVLQTLRLLLNAAVPLLWLWNRVSAYRNLIIVIIALLLVTEFHGLPHVRWSYTYTGSMRNPSIRTGRYWGPTGWRDVAAFEIGETCPFIIFLRFERSLWDYGRDAVHHAWDAVYLGKG